MADRIPARLSPAEGRRFGLTTGAAFLVLAGISLWRHHQIAPRVLAALGGALVIAGLVLPGRLSGVYRAWMGFAHALSKVTTPIILGVIWYGVITPAGAIARLFGRNPIVHRAESGSYFHQVEPRPDPVDAMRHQF